TRPPRGWRNGSWPPASSTTPTSAAAPLGAHPAMARLLLHRYDQALTGAAPAHGALTRPPLRAGA
ncbi:hypothetical protein AB0K87_29240, partial [Streptomyces sp. NPDC053705]